MSGRIWPGALCYFNHRAEPENQGATVRVLEHDASDDTWTFDSASRPIAIFVEASLVPALLIRATSEDPDNNSWLWGPELTPLTPPPASDTTQTDDTAPCEVEPAQPDRVSA